MIPLVVSVLGASLLGSPHCAGMCGGFVCFVAGQDGRRWPSVLAYHGGRLLCYVTLGFAAGAIGAGIDRLAAVRGLAHGAAFVSGAVMVAWGITALAEALGARLPWLRVASHGPMARVLRAMRAYPPVARAAAMGLLTTLLPCGWLYLFVATAGGTGSPWIGAAVMATFWVGTVPVLLGLGALARGALAPLARRLPVLTSSALVVLGLLTLAGKFHGGHAARASATSAAATETCPAHGSDHGNR